MIPLFKLAQEAAKTLGEEITYTHIPREQNKMADMFVNRALDDLL